MEEDGGIHQQFPARNAQQYESKMSPEYHNEYGGMASERDGDLSFLLPMVYTTIIIISTRESDLDPLTNTHNYHCSVGLVNH
jgi:hypothetical protein